MVHSRVRLLLMPLLVMSGCVSATKQNSISISPAALDASALAFEPHANYLQLSTPYLPIAPVLSEVERRAGVTLQSRGESHVTVITPPEFDVLKKHMTMNDLQALSAQIQSSEFSFECVGKGSAELPGRSRESTYFLVVKSADLIKLRQKIEDLYRAKGGQAADFSAAHFYPHVTLGFTFSDLHEHQGVIKDARSCVYPVTIAP